MRWVIGDIHGCARELDRLLAEIRFDPGQDELRSAGDLVNVGPDSLAVLRLWRDVNGRGVIGNHDVRALLASSGRRHASPALRPLLDAHDAVELLERLRRLPLIEHLGPTEHCLDAWLVHGGLHPDWKPLDGWANRLNAAPHDDSWLLSPEVAWATTVRCCGPNGEPCRHKGLPEDCPEPFRPWDEFHRGRSLIVHGHWARRGFYRNRQSLGLDSGCVYGGKLTAWCQEEDRIVQIPSGL